MIYFFNKTISRPNLVATGDYWFAPIGAQPITTIITAFAIHIVGLPVDGSLECKTTVPAQVVVLFAKALFAALDLGARNGAIGSILRLVHFIGAILKEGEEYFI
jgi:hypothetical protein